MTASAKNPLSLHEYALLKISPQRLSELVFGKQVSDDDTSMYADRARECFNAIIGALCELRDQGMFTLNKETILAHLSLKKILSLIDHNDVCLTKDALIEYVFSLPSIDGKGELRFENLSNKAIETHKWYVEIIVARLNEFVL